MNLTYYFSALFVGVILAIVLAVINHKKEQVKINELISKNKEFVDQLNKLMDEIEERMQEKTKGNK